MPIELVGAQVDRLAGGVRQLLDGHGFKDDSIMVGDAVELPLDSKTHFARGSGLTYGSLPPLWN